MKKAIIDVTTGETIIVDYTPEEIEEFNALYNSRDALKSYAAEKRWEVEISGVIWNGYTVATDRDSQGKLMAEFIAINAGLRTDPSGWKMKSGEFVLLTNAEMLNVIVTARTHISNAFEKERQILDEIEAGTITSTEQIDGISW